MKKWYVFFVCWVTWAWKWTLIKWLLEDKTLKLQFALSCKTRELRHWEKDWVDYIKLSFDEFKKQINAWEFLEYNFVHNQDYYWTRKVDIIDNWINKGKIIIKEIDMLVVPYLLEKMKDLRKYFSIIFLDLPIESIKDRMISRWEEINNKNYENRLASAKKERANIWFVDYIIDATKPQNQVLNEFKEIIKSKI